MQKIPTLFKRVFDTKTHKIIGITPELTDPSLQCVLDGNCMATIKMDGACCAIIEGAMYKRYDAKKGKNPPVGAISCCDPDPITGHHPYWVRVEANNPADKWFVQAYENTLTDMLEIYKRYPTSSLRTYEAIGPHFQGNPYGLKRDVLSAHGRHIIIFDEISFDTIRNYLQNTPIEGIVFWKDCWPLCKIKRSDFGFDWPCEGAGATDLMKLYNVTIKTIVGPIKMIRDHGRDSE